MAPLLGAELMLQEEPQHLARCIRTARIRVLLRTISAGPGVSGAVNDPQLAVRHATRTVLDRSRESSMAQPGLRRRLHLRSKRNETPEPACMATPLERSTTASSSP